MPRFLALCPNEFHVFMAHMIAMQTTCVTGEQHLISLPHVHWSQANIPNDRIPLFEETWKACLCVCSFSCPYKCTFPKERIQVVTHEGPCGPQIHHDLCLRIPRCSTCIMQCSFEREGMRW